MRRAWIIALASVSVFAALAIGPVADALLGGVDAAVQSAVAGQTEAARHVWDVAADILVYGVAAALCTGMGVQAAMRRDPARGAGIAILLLAMAANNAVLKPWFDRTRPSTAYVDTPAFPSGHTAAALLVSAAVLFPRITPVRLAVVVAVTALTAVARVLSGAHWVSDVLGSIAYGTLVVALMQTEKRLVAPASSDA